MTDRRIRLHYTIRQFEPQTPLEVIFHNKNLAPSWKWDLKSKMRLRQSMRTH